MDVDMKMQKVTVMGWAEQEKVLKTVRKTGRTAELWPYPYNPEYHHNITLQYYYLHHNNQPLINFHKNQLDYYENGYNKIVYNNDNGNYGPNYSSSAFDEKARVFSDENPHACSIM